MTPSGDVQTSRCPVSAGKYVQCLSTDRLASSPACANRGPGAPMKNMRKIVVLAFLSLLLNGFCLGQGAATGDLHVTVKDQKGNLVTNATIKVRDAAKGFERSS